MEQAEETNGEVGFWQRMSREHRVDLTDILVEIEEASLDPETELLGILVQTRQAEG